MAEPPIPDPPEVAEVRETVTLDAETGGGLEMWVDRVAPLLADYDRRGRIIANVTGIRDDWRAPNHAPVTPTAAAARLLTGALEDS